MTGIPPAASRGAPGGRLRLALVVPGGVDESGERRVIPVLLHLIERLAARHDVHVIALRQYDVPRTYPLLGARVTNLGLPRRFARVPGWVHAFRYRALADALSALRPDVIHAFWATGPGAMATFAGGRLGVPTLVSLAGGELVALADIAYGAQLSMRGRWLVRGTLARATVVSCASGPMAQLAARQGRVAARVPLGVPMPAVGDEAPRAARDDAGGPRLLFVGSLNRVKDPFALLDAMRRVVDLEPGARLDVVGEDTLDGAVQRYAVERGVSGRVRFHGFLPSRELAEFFRSADLLVVTSRHEAGPVVALEAASHGLPTVGTAVGHLADASGRWAETVGVGDASALADAIVGLYRDPERLAGMGRSARAWARANDADATAGRFEAIYRTLTSGAWRASGSRC